MALWPTLYRYRPLVVAVLVLVLGLAAVLLFFLRSSDSRSGHDPRSDLSLRFASGKLTVSAPKSATLTLKALQSRRLVAVCGRAGTGAGAQVTGYATWRAAATKAVFPMGTIALSQIEQCLLEEPGGQQIALVAMR